MSEKPPPTKIIESDVEGKLMGLEREDQGYSCVIRFKYYKKLMEKVNEGSFVVVENYFSTKEKPRYTLLQIVEIFPRHFALSSILESSRNPHPGFSWEAASSASKDLIEQVDTSTIDETYVECRAIPVGFDLVVESEDSVEFEKINSKPIQGMNAYVLKPDLICQLYNKGLPPETSKRVGDLALNSISNLPILIDYDKLVRLHFGVFATTGGGKSNLVATLTRCILEEVPDIKVVIFDIAGDYSALLMDQLMEKDSLLILADPTDFSEDAEQLVKRITFPRALENYKDQFKDYLRKLIESKRVRLLLDVPSLKDIMDKFLEGTRRIEKPERVKVIEAIVREIELSIATGQAFLENSIKKAYEIASKFEDEDEEIAGRLRAVCEGYADEIKRMLEIYKDDQLLPDEELPDLILSGKYSERLIIIYCPEIAKMRSIITDIASKCLIKRKKSPAVKPQVLFVFDEAHEFIPLQFSEGSDIAFSSRAIENLIRQGRKYGLGVCISSQRSRNLNTNIIAMIHTYFLGVLPMPSDRERLAEAFNIDRDLVAQTVDFLPGRWIVSSMSATGMRNVPINVKTDNSEEVVIKWLKEKKKLKKKEFEHRVDISKFLQVSDQASQKSLEDIFGS